MNETMSEKKQREIINRYCQKCGRLKTIGKKGRQYCEHCNPPEKKTKKRRIKW